MRAFLAIPTRGTMSPAVYEHTRHAAASLNTTPWLEIGHLSAGANRTAIIHRFLNTNANTLVMVDDDVLPPADLTDLVNATRDHHIVAAAYPIFQPRNWPTPVIAAWHEHNGQYGPVPDTGGLVECDAVGTGCVAIRRDAVEQIPHGFFESVDDLGRVTSDDLNFCRLARAAGMSIAVHLDVRCDHITTVSLAAVMNGVRALTAT